MGLVFVSVWGCCNLCCERGFWIPFLADINLRFHQCSKTMHFHYSCFRFCRRIHLCIALFLVLGYYPFGQTVILIIRASCILDLKLEITCFLWCTWVFINKLCSISLIKKLVEISPVILKHYWIPWLHESFFSILFCLGPHFLENVKYQVLPYCFHLYQIISLFRDARIWTDLMHVEGRRVEIDRRLLGMK